MELLNRYLEAVRKYLPWERQDDIVAELRANLEAQLEGRQEELGRSLNEEEAKAWVGQLPRPALMAGRYRRQQHLIGPGLFPIYSLLLRMAMFWLAIMLVVVNIVKAFVHPWSTGSIAMGMAWIAAGMVHIGYVLAAYAAALTLAFAAVEYLLLHHPEKFSPIAEALRTFDPNYLPPLGPAKSARTLPRAVADLIGNLALLAWLLFLPAHPFLLLGPGVFAVNALPYALAPVITEFYWALLVLTAVQAAWKTINLKTGAWRGERSVQRLVSRLLGFIPLVILLMAPGHRWLLLKDSAADVTRRVLQIGQINRAVYLGLRVVLAIALVALVAELARGWYQGYKRRVASAH